MKRHAAAVILFLVVSTRQELFGQGQGGNSSSALQVTAEDLLTTPVGENWPSYNGDYSGRRYSSLREINRTNVAQLSAAWVFHPGNSQRLQATPVVIRGVMYVTSANDVFALDASTGRTLWHYSRPVSSGLLDDAAAHKSRGVAVWEQFVYSGNRRCPSALSRCALGELAVGRRIRGQGHAVWSNQRTSRR